MSDKETPTGEPYRIHTIQLNIADLLGGTGHMDSAEFGAYVRLFIACYQSKDLTITADESKLALMAHCSAKVWRRVRTSVLQKFIMVDLRMVNDRVLREVAGYRSKSSTAKANRKKRKDSTNSVVEVSLNHGSTKPPEYRIQDTRHTIQDKTPTPEVPPISDKLTALEAGMFFSRVWAAYPGQGKHGERGAGPKGSRKRAFEKFHNLINKENDHEQFTQSVIAGCYLYDAYLSRESWCTSKHLITWLNQECWRDDYSIDESRGGTMGDAIAQGSLRALQTFRREDE